MFPAAYAMKWRVVFRKSEKLARRSRGNRTGKALLRRPEKEDARGGFVRSVAAGQTTSKPVRYSGPDRRIQRPARTMRPDSSDPLPVLGLEVLITPRGIIPRFDQVPGSSHWLDPRNRREDLQKRSLSSVPAVLFRSSSLSCFSNSNEPPSLSVIILLGPRESFIQDIPDRILQRPPFRYSSP